MPPKVELAVNSQVETNPRPWLGDGYSASDYSDSEDENSERAQPEVPKVEPKRKSARLQVLQEANRDWKSQNTSGCNGPSLPKSPITAKYPNIGSHNAVTLSTANTPNRNKTWIPQ